MAGLTAASRCAGFTADKRGTAAACDGSAGACRPSSTSACMTFAHAYAIREVRAGRDIYDLSHHLGHSSVKVTEMSRLPRWRTIRLPIVPPTGDTKCDTGSRIGP